MSDYFWEYSVCDPEEELQFSHTQIIMERLRMETYSKHKKKRAKTLPIILKPRRTFKTIKVSTKPNCSNDHTLHINIIDLFSVMSQVFFFYFLNTGVYINKITEIDCEFTYLL